MRTRIPIFLTAILAAVFMTAAPCFAVTYVDSDPDDYITKRFDVAVQTDADHVFHVHESIDVEFIQPHHGISRYIPERSELYDIKHVRVTGGDKHTESELSIDSEGYTEGYTLVRIGDADTYLTGDQSYTISYDLVCRADDDVENDYLALDFLPTAWETSIRDAKLSLTLPKPVDPQVLKFYGGAYGEDAGLPDGYDLQVSGDGREISIEAVNVPAYSGLTVQSTLEEGYWEGARDPKGLFTLWLVLLIAFPLLSVLLWLRFGRDPVVVETVEFYPPDDMTPAELGYIVDGHIDRGDMSSMLMYYAAKGGLSIHEYAKNKYELIEGTPLSDQKTFSETLYNGIFSKPITKEIDGEQKRTVQLKKMPENFGEKVNASQAALRNYYSGERRLYTKASSVCRAFSILFVFLGAILTLVLGGTYSARYGMIAKIVPLVLFLVGGLSVLFYASDKRAVLGKVSNVVHRVIGWGFVLLAAIYGGKWAIILFQDAYLDSHKAAATVDSLMQEMSAGGLFTIIWPGVLFAASLVVTIAFSILMKARTKQSAEWLGKILGFRNFIKEAEYDRLKLLSEEDPAYFYDIMPYAYVMGMSTQWAKKFENIRIEQPDWYSSYDNRDLVFSTLWYSHLMNTTTARFSNSFANMPDAGSHGSFSGGFSGGGFSGGGFGGGGGGAW